MITVYLFTIVKLLSVNFNGEFYFFCKILRGGFENRIRRKSGGVQEGRSERFFGWSAVSGPKRF